MARFASVVFLGAFLLFQVEPLICKYLLPWFGGVPAVWSACLVFFQTALLAGYAYAHASARRLSLRGQARLHLVLLGAASLLLLALAFRWRAPILPPASLRPEDSSHPALRILALLAASVGFPFFLLSATGPLLQHWRARMDGVAPYRLYALSNAGSLLALLAYPTLVEPTLPLRAQGWAWSGAFLLFALGCGSCALAASRAPEAPLAPSAAAAPPAAERLARPLLWVALAGLASVMLLAMTSEMSQNVAAIPLLWILPLALYLLSLIICFDRAAWYRRRYWYPAFGLALAAITALTIGRPNAGGLGVRLLADGATLLTGCMILHGELYRLRPTAERLTAFYLFVSLGGALGGIFVGLLAPHLFRTYWEFPLALTGCALVAVLVTVREGERRPPIWEKVARLLGATALASLAVGQVGRCLQQEAHAVEMRRDFFGVLRIEDVGSGLDRGFALFNGTIVHGWEFSDPSRAALPTAYYDEKSGLGLAFAGLRARRPAGEGLRAAVLGLGVGTSAALGRPGDRFRFYEIDPSVIRFARGEGGYFHFLGLLSAPPPELIEGDARLSLERELAAGQRGDLDLVAVDVFTGDAIPLHLLTEEAVRLYLARLRPDGVLAFHVSNKYLDLAEVVLGIGDRLGLASFDLKTQNDLPRSFASHWILLSPDASLFREPVFIHAQGAIGHETRRVVWTDDRSDVFGLLRGRSD